MKTFVSAIFLMLAASASARTFESYEQHVASIEGVGAEEMPLFEFVAKEDKGGDKEKKSDSKEKDSKKKSDDDKKSEGSKKSDEDTDSKDNSRSRSSRSRSSRSKSSSSSSSSGSSRSSSGGSGSKKTYDGSTYTGDMCCDPAGDDVDTCRTLWDTVCDPINVPTPAQQLICDHVGFDDPTCIPTEAVRTSLRGNIASE